MADVETLLTSLDGLALTSWEALLSVDRPAFLRRLQRFGITSLSERQRLANVLTRQMHARGPTGSSTSAPETTAHEAVTLAEGVVAKLRCELAGLDQESRADRLTALGLPLAFFEACDDVSAMQTVAPLRLARVIEAVDHLAPPTAIRLLPGALRYAALRVGFYIALGACAAPRAANVAAFDYADYGERLLGFTSFMIVHALDGACDDWDALPEGAAAVVRTLRARFGSRVLWLAHGASLEGSGALLSEHGLTHLYVYKYGHGAFPSVTRLLQPQPQPCQSPSPPSSSPPSLPSPSPPSLPSPSPPSLPTRAPPRLPLRVLVHAAVDGRTPHGTVYCRVSPCVQASAAERGRVPPAAPECSRSASRSRLDAHRTPCECTSDPPLRPARAFPCRCRAVRPWCLTSCGHARPTAKTSAPCWASRAMRPSSGVTAAIMASISTQPGVRCFVSRARDPRRSSSSSCTPRRSWRATHSRRLCRWRRRRRRRQLWRRQQRRAAKQSGRCQPMPGRRAWGNPQTSSISHPFRTMTSSPASSAPATRCCMRAPTARHLDLRALTFARTVDRCARRLLSLKAADGPSLPLVPLFGGRSSRRAVTRTAGWHASTWTFSASR